jgi:tRNA pseudouridine55 synthase
VSREELKGFLLVDKPVGLSSFQVVERVRHETGVKKVGHAGTLDPFASGLLVIGVGKDYTRKMGDIQALTKVYCTTMVFGMQTDTDDSYGTITQIDSELDTALITDEAVREALSKFTGTFEQMPPRYSAKKINGTRAYTLARQGIEPDLKACSITIHANDLLWSHEAEKPFICFETRCSKGTYIRSLVRDVAKEFNTVAYTKDLIRSAIGPYCLIDSLSYSELSPETIEDALIR